MRPDTTTLAVIAWALPALAPLTARAADDDAGSSPDPLFPHPVITEVLFNVPQGDAADANLDGSRHSASDEFVELFNPHPKTINLRGYTVTNRITTFDAETKRGVRFTFPAFKMPPGAVVVLFNGHDAAIPGPVGSAERPPAGPNEHFHGAYVFSMNATSPNNAMANAADFVLLAAPGGKPIDAVAWGQPDPAPPEDALRLAVCDKNPKGAVQRPTADDDLAPHRALDSTPFSPGRLPPPPASIETADAPSEPDDEDEE